MALALVASEGGGDDDENRDELDDAFLLEPVSAHVRCTRDCCPGPLRSHNRPRFAVEACVKRLPLVLRRMQYHQMIAYASVVKQWNAQTIDRDLPERPKHSVMEK